MGIRTKSIAWLSCILLSGCVADSCSGFAKIPGGFPAEETTPNAVQVRINDTGFDALENVIDGVLAGALNGGIAVPVPPVCESKRQVCCGYQCEIALDLERRSWDTPRLQVTPIDSNNGRLGIQLRTRVRTSWGMPARQKGPLGRWIDCTIHVNSARAGSADVNIYTELSLGKNEQTGQLEVDVGPATVWGLSGADISIVGDKLCSLAKEEEVAREMMAGFAAQTPDAIANFLCETCTTNEDCHNGDTCDAEGVCSAPGSTQCSQNLGIAGRLLGRELLEDVAAIDPSGKNDLDVMAAASGDTRTENGALSLAAIAGLRPALPSSSHQCVPPQDKPATTAIPVALDLNGSVNPINGLPFDMGLAVHKDSINRAVWAAHQAGYLCINVGGEAVPLLNAQLIATFIPSLSAITRGSDSPLKLQIRPQKAPSIRFGPGTVAEGPNGDHYLDEPLLYVEAKDLEIDFYALIEHRYARVFTLAIDVNANAGLDIDDSGDLKVLLGDLSESVSNYRVTNSELLAEPAEELEEILPQLIEVAVTSLASNLDSPISIPALGGMKVNLSPGDITALSQEEFLGVFVRMSPSSAQDTPSSGCSTGDSSGSIFLTALFLLCLYRAKFFLLFVAGLLTLGSCKNGDSIDPHDPGGVQQGAVGRWSALASNDSRTLAFGYDERLGDLVVAEVTSDGSPVFRHVVDGAPPPADEETRNERALQYRFGVTRPGADVGAWVSAVMTAKGPLVVYQNVDDGSVLFARESKSGWQASELYHPGKNARAGLFSSMTTGESGQIALAFTLQGQVSPEEPGGTPRTISQLVVGSAPDGAAKHSDWSFETVDELVFDDVNFMPKRPKGTGLFNQIAFHDDAPVVLYYSYREKELRLAERSAEGEWNTVSIESGDDGTWASLALENDVAHIAYQVGGAKLAYRTLQLGGGTLGPRVILDSGRQKMGRRHDVGASTKILVRNGTVYIVYQDSTVSDLWLAKKAAGQDWALSPLLTGEPGYGFAMSTADGKASFRVMTHVLDQKSWPVGRTEISTIPF